MKPADNRLFKGSRETNRLADDLPLDTARRGFMGTALKSAATGAAFASGILGRGAAIAQSSPALPAMGEYIFKGGYVLTMDPQLGDLPSGDVHVKDGVIVAVAASIGSATAEVIDAKHCILMPGFVDGHWHMMNAMWRGLVNPRAGFTYFETFGKLARFYTPADSRAGLRLALTEAINAGFTTVHNWSNNCRTPAHADAELLAHQEMGLRARWSYGATFGTDGIPWEDVSRVQERWFSGPDRMMHLGIAANQAGMSGAAFSTVARQMEKARALGLPISVHSISHAPDSPDGIQHLIAARLLGPDLQILHGVGSEPYLSALAGAGTSLALSPTVEPLATNWMPPVPEAMTAGLKLAIAVDTSAQATADMFTNMRVLLAAAHVKSKSARVPTARQLLQIATLGGASSLGLEAITGSLTPGKRADLLLVRRGDINMQIASDVDIPWLLVSSGRPENIDTVLVDGRILKRGGVVKVAAASEVMTTAGEALTRLRARAALPTLGVGG